MRLPRAPARAGCSDGFRVLAVEQHHNAFVRLSIAGHRRAVDEKAHGRIIGIVLMDREQDRLLGGLASRQVPCGRKLSSRNVHKCASSASMRSSEEPAPPRASRDQSTFQAGSKELARSAGAEGDRKAFRSWGWCRARDTSAHLGWCSTGYLFYFLVVLSDKLIQQPNPKTRAPTPVDVGLRRTHSGPGNVKMRPRVSCPQSAPAAAPR